MIVSDIINRVRPVLNDSDASGYRWPNTDLITYITDACRQILVYRPDANTVTQSITLVDGAIQTVPDTAYKLIDVECNLSSGAQGRAVTLVDAATLDAFSPSWRSGARSATIKHYMFDPRLPRRFEVYPPATAGATIQGKVALYTGTLANTTDTVPLKDEYMEPVVSFVLAKAYARDMEFAGNSELAGFYASQFNGLLGIKTNKDNAFSPAVTRKGDAPEAAAMQMGGV